MNSVLLVNPKTVNKYYHVTAGLLDRWFVRFIQKYFDSRFYLPSHSRCTTMPPITLLALQALFRRRCRTFVVDEQVEEIDFSLQPDLVCLTATTPQYGRAREIASVFNTRGIRTAIGGIHATCLPHECSDGFDTVCVGEAEGYVDEMIADLSAGRLKAVYRNDTPVGLDSCPFYDYDIVSGKYLPFYVINFSRGCPFKCEFCSVQSTLGKHRTRSVTSVVRQIADSGAREIWFADAALTANRERALALFKALIPLKINWLASIPLNIGQDEHVLDLMAASGCWLASIGFETLETSNLRACHKSQNRVEEYRNIIRALHERRIAIEGNFVFGFDGDTESVFDETAAFTVEVGIDIPEFYVLTPYPGTPLYQRLLAERRIVDHEWAHYDNTHFHYLPVFEPRNMSRGVLREGCRRADQIAYSPRNTVRRLWNTRMYRPSICITNFIFMRRMLLQNSLLPRGEKWHRERATSIEQLFSPLHHA